MPTQLSTNRIHARKSVSVPSNADMQGHRIFALLTMAGDDSNSFLVLDSTSKDVYQQLGFHSQSAPKTNV
jgi:hypothetical protein